MVAVHPCPGIYLLLTERNLKNGLSVDAKDTKTSKQIKAKEKIT